MNLIACNKPNLLAKSPWLDSSKSNLLRDEFRLAKENLTGAYYKPLKLYRWIYEHNGEQLLFKGLAYLAPMFPVCAYHGEVAVWLSPPPSGLGNAIYFVMGHDAKGELRLVGGNYFTEPTKSDGAPMKSTSFFTQYDQGDESQRIQLVRDAVETSIQSADSTLLLDICIECEHIHTMAIYITVLTDKGNFFHACKAVIEGIKPADFSYELFGEIK